MTPWGEFGENKVQAMTRSFHIPNCRPVLGAAFAVFLAAPVMAATTDGDFATRGIGAQSCGALLTAFAGPDGAAVSDQLASWLAGYLSGTSRLSPSTFDALPIQDVYGVATIVLRVCQQNEPVLVETVAAEIVQGFLKAAPKIVSPVQTVVNDTASVEIRASVMQSVQNALVELELMPASAADGAFGPTTRDSLIAFQTSLGITPTGLPDAVTIFALLFEDS